MDNILKKANISSTKTIAIFSTPQRVYDETCTVDGNNMENLLLKLGIIKW